MKMMNSLTREVGFKVGPVILEVLVKHYFERLKKDVENSEDSAQKLKGDDVLYHEAFTIVKQFLHAATTHTVEELQSFSNTRTPSPPWTHVVRTLVPLSCCDEAATYLIKALGGEDVAIDLVGGVKWWQVRGLNGIDAQWITAKKDWNEAERKRKQEREQTLKDNLPSPPPMGSKHGHQHKADGVYEKDMDAMRCILYLHGGGYYFGSVDQERYSIQRHARKINGRVFAINYRLAPQYPFPCALQDAIAAYLYLIQPPPGADHVAVNPAHIIIAGDSAGGGLSIALLQVIRDCGLPLPAGAFLISPWCDLTHSFPSIHLNTGTDIIPECGLSFHKPSTLWPPPPPEIATRVHASLRFRIRQAFKLEHNPGQTDTIVTEKDIHLETVSEPVKTPAVPPIAPEDRERVVVQTDSGQPVVVHNQLQFYAQNSLLDHPLVSPVNSYLGGLPPLFVTAGENEVLRDEIIYMSHKAAYPERYPISDKARSMYPLLRGIEDRYKPTSVHLQVYDGTPHILPVLFSFCTPAKYCFRAIASFCKFVTEMGPTPMAMSRETQSTSNVPAAPVARRRSLFSGFRTAPPDVGASASRKETLSNGPTLPELQLTSSPLSLTPAGSVTPRSGAGSETSTERPSLRRVFSDRLGSRSGSLFRTRSAQAVQSSHPPAHKRPSTAPKKETTEPKADETQPFAERLMEKLHVGRENEVSISASDVAGPRFQVADQPPKEPAERMVGEMEVYQGIKDRSTWECRMIRERVSTAGVVRPLEPEEELDAFKMECSRVGCMPEKTIQRYLRDRGIFDKRYAHTMKSIEKVRRHNLEKAKKDTIKRMHELKQTMSQEEAEQDSEVVGGVKDGEAEPETSRSGAANGVANGSGNGNGTQRSKLREKVLSSPNWVWAWALDDSERPPPSSIVSRRDTDEARKLAAVADWANQEEDQTLSGNNLWAVVQNFLTATPGRDNHVLRKGKSKKKEKRSGVDEEGERGSGEEEERKRGSLDGTVKGSRTHLGVEQEKDGVKKRRSFLEMLYPKAWGHSTTSEDRDKGKEKEADSDVR